MVRATTIAIALLLTGALPAIADTGNEASSAPDLVAADPLVTDTQAGRTTYFGETKTQPDKAQPDSVAAKPPVQPEPAPTVIAKINLGSQQMTVSVNGVQRYVWPISSGVSRFPTPTGKFRPEWTSKMWYSRKYDWAPMPYAVFISGGVAVHGTYHTGALGSPASHGCIRLNTANARTFYNLVERHGLKATRVTVFGRPNWGGEVAVGRSGSRKKVYANTQPKGFGGEWADAGDKAWPPDAVRRRDRATYVIVDGVPRKVYRRRNGDFLSDGRRRRSYEAYGYGYDYGPNY